MQSREQDLKLGEKSIKQTQTTWHSWRGGFRSYKLVAYGQIMIEMATVVQVWFSAHASVPGGPSVPRGQNKDTLWTFHAPGITPIGICLFSISISGLHVSFLGKGDYPDNCAAVQTYPQRLQVFIPPSVGKHISLLWKGCSWLWFPALSSCKIEIKHIGSFRTSSSQQSRTQSSAAALNIYAMIELGVSSVILMGDSDIFSSVL